MSAETDAALLFMADKLTALGLQENADVLRALISERDRLRAELARIQAAPVVVPEMTEEEIDAGLDRILRASGSALRHYTLHKSCEDMRHAMRETFIASRLRTVQPGEVVVDREVLEQAAISLENHGYTEDDYPMTRILPLIRACPATNEKEADHGK